MAFKTIQINSKINNQEEIVSEDSNFDSDNSGYRFTELYNLDNNDILLKISENSDSKFDIESFIEGKNKSLEFLYSIENNENNTISENTINTTIEYKKEIINKENTLLKNKLQMFLEKSDVSKLHNSFLKKFSNISNIKENIVKGIKEKTNKINSNSFEIKFKNFVKNNENSKYFNVITNNFFNNVSVARIDKYKPKQKKEFLQNNEEIFSNEINFIDQRFIKQNQFFFELNTDVDFSKEVKTRCSDIVVQNLINLTRSMFTLSSGCFVENHKTDDRFLYINLDNTSLINLNKEKRDFRIFDHINNLKINNKSLIDENLNNIKNKEYTINTSEDTFFTNSIDAYAGLCHLPSSSKNILNSFISNYKNNLEIAGPDLLESNASLYISSLGFHANECREINKIFVDNIYNVDTTGLNNQKLKDVYDYIYKGESPEASIITNAFSLKNNLANHISTNKNLRPVYLNESPIFSISPENISTDESGFKRANTKKIKIKKEFFLDSKFNINSLRQKTKIDNFVKQIKIKHLKNKNVSLDFFNEIVENINDSDRKDTVLSYCKEDDKNISALNSENDAFNLLFTADQENENIFYSNVDIISNQKIKGVEFKGIDDLKKKNLNFNIQREEFANNFLNLISHYYPENHLFSSSSLFYNILKSIYREAENSSHSEYEDYSLSQALYLNYFREEIKNQTNKDIKKIIATRFIKNAIYNDSTIDQNLSEEGISDFKYNYTENDGDFIDIENILSSSSNLENIRKSVYSNFNIKDLSKRSEFKTFNSIKLIKDGSFYDSTTNSLTDRVYVAGLIITQFIPMHKFLINFRVRNNFSNKLKTQYKQKIDDSILNKKLKIKIIPYLNDDYVYNREENKESYALIEDYFDECCNENNFIFNYICHNIKSILRLLDPNYKEKLFENESQVDDYILNNDDLINKVIEIIEIFSNYYLLYFDRISRANYFKFFTKIPVEIDHNKIGKGENQNIPDFGIVSKNKNLFQELKNALKYGDDFNFVINNSDQNKEMISDIKRIIDSFESSQESYFTNNTLYSIYDNPITNWKSSETLKIYNILKSLYSSDVSQSFYFDIIKGLIQYQNEVIEMNRESISSSKYFNQLKSFLEDSLVDKIEENFHNIFFINKLSKSIFKDEYLNKKIEEDIFDNVDADNLDYYLDQNNSILNTEKNYKLKYLENFSLDLSNDYIKESLGSTAEDFYNSSMYSFALKDDILKNKNKDVLIKITVSIVDQLNLNRLYIPKVYLFSPMFTNLNKIDFSEFGINNKNCLGYYNIEKDIENRLNLFDIEENLNERSFISSKIRTLFNVSHEESIELQNYLLYCHLSSNKVDFLTKNIYNIDILENNNVFVDNLEVFEMFESLNKKEFFSIFKNRKDKTINRIKMNENILLPNKSDSFENENSFYDLLINLDNIGKNKSVKDLSESEIYDNYNIAINPKNFYYIDVSGNEQNNEYSQNDLQKILSKLLVVNQSLLNNNFKKDSKLISNFNIIVETEVL